MRQCLAVIVLSVIVPSVVLPDESSFRKQCVSLNEFTPVLKYLRNHKWEQVSTGLLQQICPFPLVVNDDCRSTPLGKDETEGKQCRTLHDAYCPNEDCDCGVVFDLHKESTRDRLYSVHASFSDRNLADMIEAAKQFIDALSPVEENSLDSYMGTWEPDNNDRLWKTYDYHPEEPYTDSKGTHHASMRFLVQIEIIQHKGKWFLGLTVFEPM